MIHSLAALLLALVLSRPAPAQPEAPAEGAAPASTPASTPAPLTGARLLDRIDARVPKLAAVRYSLAEKEAALLAARGAFDPTLSAKAKVKDQEPYRWTVTDEAISLATPVGPSVEVGHRLGVGKLPIYEGGDKTLELGEVRLDVAIPLLQDLGITAERAKALVKEAEVRAAQAKVQQAEVDVTAKAVLSWAKWVAAGEKRALARVQVELAQRRSRALARQVEEGSAARIDQADNDRALAERRGELAEAEQDLEVAAQALSLWYRDDEMQPVVPGDDELPLGTPQPNVVLPPVGPALAAAARNRPDLLTYDALLDAADVELRRARSALLPELDVTGGVARDLSNSVERPLETRAGVGLKVPLLLRKGRGGLDAAKAAQGRLREERRGAADAVNAEVHQAWAAARGAAERWRLAAEAVALAEEVARLERRAFELGRSSLFVVIKREEAVAKATKQLIEARMAWRAAAVAAAASTGEPVTAERL